MKAIFAAAACGFLALCAPSDAQISAGVGHQLKEASPDISKSAPSDKGNDANSDMSEGRAAATNSSNDSSEGKGLERDWKPAK